MRIFERAKNSPLSLVRPFFAFDQEHLCSVQVDERSARADISIANLAQVTKLILICSAGVEVWMLWI
ncbi:hypothetical protein ADT26_08105 [Xanthomonas oryzae]|nr:hypothetical protein AXO1947_08475 [Xanthomonas oryzae pv. oryzae]KOR45315.1 hypothetical protein ADT26_08105 [Xanthomonas oryzae]